MVSDEVYDAVREGRFHIWAVDYIDQGIEILTGMRAGSPDGGPDTVMGRVAARLREYADVMSKSGKEDKALNKNENG